MLLRRFVERRRGETPVWLTVYSDMMTNLTLFFLMLYGLTRMGSEAWNKASDQFHKQISGKKIDIMAKEFDFKEIDISEAEIDYEKNAVRIAISDEGLFDSGDAELKPDSIDTLHKIAETLHDLPNTIVIEGHTDNVPLKKGSKYVSNWELSAVRAENVVRYFVHKEGFSPKRFAVAAYGEYRPVAPNDTGTGRRKNRRTELVVLSRK